MPRIADYGSLSQAIQDFAHRSSLSSYIDYFIQGGESRIYTKLLEMNEGEGIRAMEAPLLITIDGLSGQAPVPVDYISMKNAVLLDGAFAPDLIVKEPQWIRARYRNSQYQGPPAYIARDVYSVFVGSIAAGVLTVSQQISGSIGTNQPLFGPNIPPGVIISGPTGPPNTWNVSIPFGAQADIDSTITIDSTIVTIDNIAVDGDTMTTGGFIFGPFPDGAYQISGAYYQRATPLSSANPTNWMVSQLPFAMLSACLAEVEKFLKNPDGEKAHISDMEDRLSDIVLADKAERYAGGSLVISCV